MAFDLINDLPRLIMAQCLRHDVQAKRDEFVWQKPYMLTRHFASTVKYVKEKRKNGFLRMSLCIDIAGDSIAAITYRKICNAIEILPKWEPAAKIQFLEQFLNISDLLDDRCTELVTNLARLSWQVIPEEIMDRYLNMLCDVAIRQVTHTEIIYCSAVSNLIPVMKLNEEKRTTELALSFEEQDKYYTMAHRVIAQIYKCFPMSTKILLKALRVGVPHFSHDSWRFIGYMRNLVQCLEYAGKIRADIWELIIDQMIMCD
ncbi:hypothetical protein TELCIR_12278, partial [Teladorsagia circumcincta]